MNGQTRTILLVEDQLPVIELIRQAFVSHDSSMHLTAVRSLREARISLAGSLPDLAIVELRLPDGQGMELFPPDSDAPPYPIVILTSYGDVQAAVEAIQMGASDYVVKSSATLTDLPRIADRALRAWGQNVERQRAEKALQTSELHNRALIEGSIQGIYIHQDLTIQFANQAMAMMFGYDGPQELIGQHFQVVVAPHERPRLDGMRTARLRGDPVPQRFEFQGIRKDGSGVWIECLASIIPWDGKPATMGAFLDITARREAQETTRQWAEEQEVLAAIGRTMSSSLNINEVYESFAEEVRRLIPYDRVTISLIDPTRGSLCNTYQTGLPIPTREPGTVVPLAGSMAEIVMHTQACQIFHPQDTSEVSQRAPNLLPAYRSGLRAFLMAPLTTQGMVQGIMLLQSRTPDFYTERELRLAESVAAQIAGTITNAELYQERQRTEAALATRIEQMEAVRDISAEITRELDLNVLFELIIRRVIELTGATSSAIHLLDEAEQVLITRAHYGTKKIDITGLRHSLGEGLVGLVAARRQGLNVNNYPQAPGALSHLVSQLGSISMLLEPLLYRERLVGVISCIHKEGHPFSADDQALLAVFAAQAAIAIENARLFEESTQRQERLASILEINKRIATSKDLEQLLGRIAEEAMRLIGASGAIAGILEGDYIVCNEKTIFGVVVAEILRIHIGQGISGRAIRENCIVMAPDVQSHPDIPPEYKAHCATLDIHSMISTPIRGSRGGIGVLNLTSCEPRVFTADELAALTAYAEQAAIALESSQLILQVEHSNTNLRREIAERQRVQEEREILIAELEAKNAELERFTYTVSHDLKSPLVTIRGFLGLLEQDVAAGDTERLQDDIAQIYTASGTMYQLLDDLLELSRIGRVTNSPQEVAFGALACEVVDTVTGAVASRGIQVSIASDLPSVFGDRTRLREVLQNLLDNAIKFLGDRSDPYIEIGHRQENETTVFFVRDNGIGINPQYRDKVFDLFERLDAASDGTGIGLAIVKRIVEVHGGRIWIESAGAGQGCTVCFTLPRVAQSVHSGS